MHLYNKIYIIKYCEKDQKGMVKTILFHQRSGEILNKLKSNSFLAPSFF